MSKSPLVQSCLYSNKYQEDNTEASRTLNCSGKKYVTECSQFTRVQKQGQTRENEFLELYFILLSKTKFVFVTV